MLLVLRSPLGRRQIEQHASGNQLSMRNLSQSNLKGLSVPMPSDDERSEIVRRTSELLAQADRIERAYKAVTTKITTLTPSLLAKAFRGELVPQDPNDEPAAKLLARLRTQPDSGSTNKPKRGRPRATRAKATGTDAP
ncbi:MAG: hypothetical protein KIT72_02790 [Polyangiaceae bacterium]|nr:hypothetical protein [Polyangiaceae bacterium]